MRNREIPTESIEVYSDTIFADRIPAYPTLPGWRVEPIAVVSRIMRDGGHVALPALGGTAGFAPTQLIYKCQLPSGTQLRD